MSYNIKPTAPPLDINHYDSRNEGETVDDLSNKKINNNSQSVQRQVVSIPEQQIIYTPYRQQQQPKYQDTSTYDQPNTLPPQQPPPQYQPPQQQLLPPPQQQPLPSQYQSPPQYQTKATYGQPNISSQQQFVYQSSIPSQQPSVYPYSTKIKYMPKYNQYQAKNPEISQYTYTSFPHSMNRSQSSPSILRLPLSSQIFFTSKSGINCVCTYCYHYQTTNVKLKRNFISYFYCFVLTMVGCCCIYPCIGNDHKDRYHYCSNCFKLLGHS